MQKADILTIGTYPEWDIKGMEADYTLHTGVPGELSPAVAAKLRAVAFKGHSRFGAAEMDALPNLGLIANFGVGYDAIDVAAASARGIKVTNTPDVLTDDVADLALGMALGLFRQIPRADAWVRSGDWAAKGDFPLQRKFSGKRVGILGLGRIGRAIAERMTAFDMQISYWSRAPKDTPAGWTHVATPEALAAEVDILVVALSGGPETAGLASAEVIAALGPKGVLVNISRGSTVDEAALLDALESGALGGAALDVFASEPDADPRFAALDNVLLQPHQASATVETRQEMGKLQRANLAAFFAGTSLLTPVN
ncbi:2-hydroxyacid dehydrogenase [Oceanibium sediminis]|uniref:2-hydroxyacid dehydrogenase n=1 Tax=Oceanibium sediminis TaxID=2026339 RepID=UPI000DD4045B|nr:2-hydroxyacid dehydrogenase [Oceanibium sediminis]